MPHTHNFYIILFIIYFAEEQWKLLCSLTNKYYILTTWGIFWPVVSIRHPDDLEVIKEIQKKFSVNIMVSLIRLTCILQENF